MIFRESENVELKAIVADDVKKEVIAFANCDGGKLYIGVQDDGMITGVEDADGTVLQVSNMICDAIKPDLTMFLHYETLEIEGKHVIAIDIQRGTERPYYIAKKGLRPEGVYVRQGYSSVPATDTMIRHTIKIAVFQDTDQSIFKDRHEFTGSLMQQLNDIYAYIDLRNQTRATFDKLRRIDTRDYPEVAVRETLLNMLVHRDYGFSASALISIYADHMEFVSVGGLLPGIDLEDVMVGLSVCRNQDLANVFYHLELIEAYGTGIRKIMKAYENAGKTPIIETTNNTFKVTLPNINYGAELEKSDSIDSDEEWIINFVKKNGEIVRTKVETQLGISASTASRMLRKMVEAGLLAQRGKGRSSKYVLPDCRV